MICVFDDERGRSMVVYVCNDIAKDFFYLIYLKFI